MEDKNINNSIIIACIAGIIVVSIFVISGAKSEGFTELYFLDYSKAPEKGVISFKYGISNHEAKDINYNVSFLIDENQVKSKIISLKNNETFVEEYAMLATDSESKLAVEITYADKKEEIHFFTKKS